jgi:hypothetical protein
LDAREAAQIRTQPTYRTNMCADKGRTKPHAKKYHQAVDEQGEFESPNILNMIKRILSNQENDKIALVTFY